MCDFRNGDRTIATRIVGTLRTHGLKVGLIIQPIGAAIFALESLHVVPIHSLKNVTGSQIAHTPNVPRVRFEKRQALRRLFRLALALALTLDLTLDLAHCCSLPLWGIIVASVSTLAVR